MRVAHLISSFQMFCKYLKQLHNLDKDSIDKIQLSKYKELVNYAWHNVPAYRKLWESHGFNPSMLNTLNDIVLIPIIDKNFVRENFEFLLANGYDKTRLSIVTTGGTTGMPMKFYIDQYAARSKELAYQLWAGWRFWRHRQCIDRVVIMRGKRIKDSLISKGIYWQRNMRENGIYMSSFHISDKTYDIYIDKLRNYKPKYIKAYPSSIVALCLLMKRNGDKGIDGLKGVICSSETIYDSHRKLIREVLGVEILSLYGHSEKVVCAYQNENGYMEFPPLYGYVEFLDDNGKPVGQKGSRAYVVATSYDNFYFPFIRYQTDDCVDVHNSGVIKEAEKILGRKQEFVYNVWGNKLPFTCSDETIWNVQGIKAYQYVQNKFGLLELHLQVDGSFKQESVREIISESEKIFINCKVNIVFVEGIEKTISGKFRYLIQNVKED